VLQTIEINLSGFKKYQNLTHSVCPENICQCGICAIDGADYGQIAGHNAIHQHGQHVRNGNVEHDLVAGILHLLPKDNGTGNVQNLGKA
jgi:hypothetical protein